jgi:pantoate--beta-alanine ligase
MQILDSVDTMRAWVAKTQGNSETIGLVPTLGCLHKGHAHLLNQARNENDRVVLSVFVNPIQFRRKAFEVYPRRLEHDLIIADECGVDAVFVPNFEQMYPYGGSLTALFALQDGLSGPRDADYFTIDKVGIDRKMSFVRVPERLAMKIDGKLHPWHFDGVATVVRKLFNIIHPTRAYFGEKDIQQLAILEAMNDWLDTCIEIIRVPAVRDPDGLASSSRLVMLSDGQRKLAVCITHLIAESACNPPQCANQLVAELEREMNSIETGEHELIIEAIECVNPVTLEPAVEFDEPAMIYVAYIINGIRLAETRSITS